MPGYVRPSDQHSPLDRTAPLIVNFDFGTAFSSVCYCRELEVEGEFPKIIHCYYWGKVEKSRQVPSQIAWDPRNKRWVKGFDVDRLVGLSVIAIDDVFAWPKMGLYDSPENETVRARHTDQLSRTQGWVMDGALKKKPTIEDLIVEFLRWLADESIGWIRQRYSDGASASFKCKFAVPAD